MKLVIRPNKVLKYTYKLELQVNSFKLYFRCRLENRKNNKIRF